MVNYKSRNDELGGSVVGGDSVGGALKILETMKLDKSEKPKLLGGSLFGKLEKLLSGGAKPHGSVVEHLIDELTPKHFNMIRQHARSILHGKMSMEDVNLGAVRDIASAKYPQHLIDMIVNDYHLGGDMSGGSFLHTLKKIGNGIISVGKVVAPFAPLLL
tara:strand:+ start:4913 stop:5392 length:480 start_codon:yes stop_codon:yes gene_type:complete